MKQLTEEELKLLNDLLDIYSDDEDSDYELVMTIKEKLNN